MNNFSYFIIATLVFLLGFSHVPEPRKIKADTFSGIISLTLKHGIWKEWQGKPVYQSVILDLLCENSRCTSKVIGYAPRFDQCTEYVGTIQKMRVDNAWHLKIKMNYSDLLNHLPNRQNIEGYYNIELIPNKDGLIGSYIGKLGEQRLRGSVQGTIYNLANLKANYQPLDLEKGTLFSLKDNKNSLKNYQVYKNINYLTINHHPLYLDLYQNKSQQPSPTLIYIHGGGWIAGEKPSYQAFLPYLKMGFSVVNIEYRLADVAPAPAAVEDCLCALNWVVKNAETYHFDPQKIVVTGGSAGGHLALMTGMVTAPSILAQNCPIKVNKIPKVAAIINWLGPTDLTDLLTGKHQRDYALKWLAKTADPSKTAQLVSPIDQINPNTPPILTIHGDQDQIVPYEQAVRLHQGLNKAGVINGLVTIKNGKHGDFATGDTRQSYLIIESFLRQNGVLKDPPIHSKENP